MAARGQWGLAYLLSSWSHPFNRCISGKNDSRTLIDTLARLMVRLPVSVSQGKAATSV